VQDWYHLNKADKPGEGKGGYGTRRDGDRTHTGIDIQGPSGTPIVAIGDGKVVRVALDYRTVGYGLQVIVNHKNGYYSQYAHLDSIAVSQGDTVAGGYLIGTLGKTGNTPVQGDAHLHFEIRVGSPNAGFAVNPLPFFTLPIKAWLTLVQ
jgi:murein DD-endopeptidase MepM/ murein hydrolase activator NlpD